MLPSAPTPSDRSHPLLSRPDLIERHGRHCGAVGLLIHTDGTCQHVNEIPSNVGYGFCHYSTGLQQPKIDGPIIKEVARLAPLIGRPTYYACCDEDPFVMQPALSYARPPDAPPLLHATKLRDFRQALGQDVAVLTTTLVRRVPSDACVGLIPAFDSWAAGEAAPPWMLSLHKQPLRPELPYAKRRDCAVWRGARTGGDPSTSLRGRVVEACAGKAWADVRFVSSVDLMMMGGTVMLPAGGGGGGGAGGAGEISSSGELTREQQAGYKIILAIDGHTWPSCWEWVLASGSVVVYAGVWAFHLSRELRPWVHYVPCEKSVTQLEERIRWVLEHPAEAEQMVANAYQLFKHAATPEYTAECVRATLRSLVLPKAHGHNNNDDSSDALRTGTGTVPQQ